MPCDGMGKRVCMRLGIGCAVSSKFKSMATYLIALALILGSAIFVAPQFFNQIAHASVNIWIVDASFLDETQCISPTFQCKTIQAAVAAATGGDTINVAAGTYNLTSRINVNKVVNILGDITTPSNVIINAPVAGGTQHGQNSVFVITSSDVTIRGFKIQGALHTGLAQNAGIYVDDPRLLSNPGLSNITISDNELTNNGYGIIVMNIKNSTISNNKVFANKKATGANKYKESGIGIVVYGNAVDANHTSNLTISGNDIYDNDTEGIRVGVGDEVGPDYLALSMAITISGNNIYNNGSLIADTGFDTYIGIKSSGFSNGVTVTGNNIYNHTGTTISATSGNAGIQIFVSKNWAISNNNIHDNANGIFFAYSKAFGSDSGGHTITSNDIYNNVRGISIDDGTEAVANNKNSVHSNDNAAFSGIGFVPYDIYNNGAGAFDATNNWWGNIDPNFTSILYGTDNIYAPYYINVGMTETNVQAISSLGSAKTAEGLLISSDYVSYSAVTAALSLTESTNAEILSKTTALNSAMSGLVTVSSVFSTISSTLTEVGISNNLNTVAGSNWKAFPGLSFEKSVDGVKIGSVTFASELDLSSVAIQTFLQNLGDYMEAGLGSMKFDAATVDQMKNAGAEIKMYGINAIGYTGIAPIIVKDDAGNILSEGDINYPVLSGISYVAGDGGTLIFSTSHFTQFVLPTQSQTTPDGDGAAVVDAETPEVVLTDPTQAVGITITNGTENPTINVSAFIADGAGVLPEITINSDIADVAISDGTTVTGPADWNGVLSAPVSGAPVGGNAPTGFTVGDNVITVGYSGGTLLFDKAVVITLSGVTGTVGYRPSGSTQWVVIDKVCSGTYTNPTGAIYPGECYISNGTDTKILTFHFTSFGGLAAVVVPPVVVTPDELPASSSADVVLTQEVISPQSTVESSVQNGDNVTNVDATSNNDTKVATDTKSSDNIMSVFGLAWYWWLAILVVVGLAGGALYLYLSNRGL